MPPEPEMGLGEDVKMSGQWRVAAVTFGVVLVCDRFGTGGGVPC